MVKFYTTSLLYTDKLELELRRCGYRTSRLRVEITDPIDLQLPRVRTNVPSAERLEELAMGVDVPLAALTIVEL